MSTPGTQWVGVLYEGALGTRHFFLCHCLYKYGGLTVPLYVYSAGKSRCWATSLHHIHLLGQIGPVSFWASLLSLLPGSSSLLGPASTSLQRTQNHASCASTHPARPSLRATALSCRRWHFHQRSRVSGSVAALLLFPLHRGRQGEGSKVHRSRFWYQSTRASAQT